VAYFRTKEPIMDPKRASLLRPIGQSGRPAAPPWL